MKFRVLTLDGGGMRGIIPAAILAFLESEIQEISKKPNARIIDYFDFISGTAVGSITAASMLVPNDFNRPKYSMENIVDFYRRLGPEVFTIPNKYKLKTLYGFIGPMIPEENMEKILLHIFGHYKMKDLIKPAIFPAYDIDKRKVVLYTTNDKTHKYSDFFVKDVIRGTNATPYIFRPGYFRNGIDIHTIIDGGMLQQIHL
jgi:patatin-like phospholipase/acyl hydrolase